MATTKMKSDKLYINTTIALLGTGLNSRLLDKYQGYGSINAIDELARAPIWRTRSRGRGVTAAHHQFTGRPIV